MVIAKLMKSIGGKKTAPAKTGAAVKNDGSCVVLDHPQQGEKIASPDYTLRVGTVGDVERVEISIDQGPWLPCRYSVGYWWHDWTGYPAGRHQAEAKAWARDGKVYAAGPVKFQVSYGKADKKTK